jgi:hypothetical protein
VRMVNKADHRILRAPSLGVFVRVFVRVDIQLCRSERAST